MKLIIRVTLLSVIAIGILQLNVTSQSLSKRDSIRFKKTETRGNKYYRNFSYMRAIGLYEKLIEKGYQTDSLTRHLAMSYFKISDTKRSESLFETLVLRNTYTASDLYYYIQSLKYNQKYREADVKMDQYIKENPSDSRGLLQKQSLELVRSLTDSSRYDINNVSFNSVNSDFGAIDYDGDILFASSRRNQAIIRFEDAWKETSYYGLYRVKRDNSAIVSAKIFSKKFNTVYNDGPVILNDAGDEIFVTRNSYRYHLPKKGAEGINNLKILYGKKTGSDSWSTLRELPFNSNDYSCGHPSLTSDGKILYFSSNMPGGFGLSDIYYVTRSDSGWSAPVNLGKSINTEGDEMFPFISSEGILYFASNGREGIGGLDLYASRKREDGTYIVKNMGFGANSSSDDFGLFLRKDGKSGYFASNRKEGRGDDDIYSISILSPVDLEIKTTRTAIDSIPKQMEYGIFGNVFIKGTTQIVPDVSVRIFLSSKELFAELKTISSENFRVKLEPETDYEIVFSKADFLTRRISYSTKNRVPGYVNINEFVEVAVQKLEIGAIVEIPNIYYDLSKWNIRPDAAIELAKVVQFLNDNPTVKVELGSHTDSRGSDSSNQVLSQNRAQAAVDFIVKSGIDIRRITAKGYGETKLKNRCVNGAVCSEEEHQQNRRTEIRITGF